MMFDKKQSQKAGDNSQLIQANTINICNGIDEKRAREIYAEKFANARKDFTEEAYIIANERVQQFENSLLPKMMQIEGALKVFADPAFQFLLSNAQKTAAATERETDYDMLSELLVCHIQNRSSRKTRTGISHAVEIIDKIDNDALCALTVVYAVNNLNPNSVSCKQGIKILAGLFEKLLYMDLPTGTDWIEHLDILGAVRINSFGKFNNIDTIYSNRLVDYSEAGIEIDSDNHKKALELLSEVNLPHSILIQNELLNNYVKLPTRKKEYINNLKITYTVPINDIATQIEVKINQQQINILESIFNLYNNDEAIKQKAVTALMNEFNIYPTLQKLRSWWNTLPYSFTITHVGKVLAHANAQRSDKSIPDFPLPI